MKIYITGTKRGLGKSLESIYGNANSLESSDIFINCKHDSFTQVEMLFKAAELNKRIINIGSNSPDLVMNDANNYQIEKFALEKANEQLFYLGINTTIVRFGPFDSPRIAHKKQKKMSIDYCCSVIKWILEQPHRIKDITVCP